jgi:hypothetical protein
LILRDSDVTAGALLEQPNQPLGTGKRTVRRHGVHDGEHRTVRYSISPQRLSLCGGFETGSKYSKCGVVIRGSIEPIVIERNSLGEEPR